MKIQPIKSLTALFLFTLAAPLWAQTNAAVKAGHEVEPAVNALLHAQTPIAIIAPFVFVLAIIAIIHYSRYRKNKMLHETLRAMIDKGAPIPPELFKDSKRPRNDFRTGLILIGIGAGLAIFNNNRAGFIVLFMGAAFLAASFFERKSKNDQQPPKP